MNILETVHKKIPGEIVPLPRKASQGYIDDLKKKQKFELLELLERQEKLLTNKNFIAKLPDKGEKIRNFKDKISQELQHRNTVEDAAKLLSRLNIATEGKAAMNELEWTGKYTEAPKEKGEKIVELDSDDEEDPLKILAQPTGSGVHKQKVIHLVTEESLIKPEDLNEIESFKIMDPLQIDHVRYIVNKVENPDNANKREPFKPYKTTKSNVHDPEKEKSREIRKTKHWEVTAATPPLIVHGAAKSLDIKESLRLQKDQAARLQQIQAENAAQRLAQQIGVYRIGDLPRNIGTYQIKNKENSDSSSSEDENYEEVCDEEDDDKRGTVVFTVNTEET